jgi:hypothetical protein
MISLLLLLPASVLQHISIYVLYFSNTLLLDMLPYFEASRYKITLTPAACLLHYQSTVNEASEVVV